MTNKNKIINQAQKFIQKGQWDKAIKELQKLVAEDPSDVRTLLKLGDVFAKKGDREQATKVYKQVAESYSEQGFFLKAVAVYKQILKHDQKNLEVTLKLAELYEHLGLTSEAMVQYQVASQLHDETGNSRDALDVLKRMVELDAENVASRIKLAESYSRENLVGEAIEQFTRAAEILKRQGRVDDYIKVAERLVYHDPNRIEVIKELANIYVQRGDTKRGLAKLQLCFKAQPRDVETLTLLAGAFRDLGQLQKTVFVYRELSRIHQENGDEIAARSTLQKILEIDPSDAEARAALGFGGNTGQNAFGTGSGRMNAGFGGNTGPLPATFATQTGPMTAQGPPMFVMPDNQAFGGAGSGPSNNAYGGPTPTGAQFGGGFQLPPARAPSIAPRPAAPPRAEQNNWRAQEPHDERLDFGSSARGLAEFAQAQREAPLPMVPPAPVQRTNPPTLSGGATDGLTISKILTETDVYIKYGLRDKALEHLRRIFELDPDNTLAYTKMRDIYASAGDNARAAEAVANLIHIHAQTNNEAALQASRSDLERLAPGHPLIAGNVTPGAWAFGQQRAHAEIDSIDITEDSDVSDVYDLNDVAEEGEPEPATQQEHDSLDAWLQQDPSGEETPNEPAEAVAEPQPGDPFSLYPQFGEEGFEDSSSSVSVADRDIVSTSTASGVHNRFAEHSESGYGHSFESEATESGVQKSVQATPQWSTLAREDNAVPDLQELGLEFDVGGAQSEEELMPEPELEPLRPRELQPDDLVDGDVEDPFAIPDTGAMPSVRPNTADLDLGLASSSTAQEDDLPEASTSAVVALDDLSSDLAFTPLAQKVNDSSALWDDAPAADAHSNGAAALSPFTELQTDGLMSPEEAQQIEDELDEAEFLAQQGLEDEAREALEAVLAKVPTNARALEIRAIFDSSLIGMPKPGAVAEVDAGEEEAATASSGDISDDDVANAFDNLGASAGDDNPEDHYDEGMAYKELGRFDDAISHFRVAVKSAAREIAALEMIGQCLLSKNDFEGAINSFWMALERGPEPAAATNLKYEIANAYEVAGDLQQAVTWYHACWSEDPEHRDVADRLRTLGIDPEPNGSANNDSAPPSNGAAGASTSSDLPGSSSKKSKISYL